jgi:hypothetical protein
MFSSLDEVFDGQAASVLSEPTPVFAMDVPCFRLMDEFIFRPIHNHDYRLPKQASLVNSRARFSIGRSGSMPSDQGRNRQIIRSQSCPRSGSQSSSSMIAFHLFSPVSTKG